MNKEITKEQMKEYESVWYWAGRTRARVTERDLQKALETLQEWIDKRLCGDTFPERLDYAMRKKGVSGAELSRMCGVSSSAINRIRSGGAARTTTILKLAKSLGVTVGWLMGEEGRRE